VSAAGPERRRIGLADGELAYVEAGQGPPVVLLHGFPTSSFLWRRLIPLLATRMRVLAPDLLGYGASDKPADADLSVTAQARRVGELLTRLGVERAALVGHDLGGAVAQLLALDGRAEALVLLDAACFDAWPIEGVRMLQAAPAERQTARFAEEVVRLALDLGVAHRGRLDEAAVRGYVEPWLENPPALFRAARGIDGRGLAGREADLAALDLPAMVVWGEEDPFLPVELAERLGEALDGSMVALLPGCSHLVTEDAASTVEQLVHEFLRLRYLGESHGHGAGSGPVPIFLERPPEHVLHGGLEDE
jgi:2-hydroxymuconate-semialdehyde hydrolase